MGRVLVRSRCPGPSRLDTALGGAALHSSTHADVLGRADELAEAVAVLAELEHAGGRAVDAHLVLDRRDLDVVALAVRERKTLVVVRDLYPSKEALDAGIGSTDGMGETFDQLDALLLALGASAGRS